MRSGRTARVARVRGRGRGRRSLCRAPSRPSRGSALPRGRVSQAVRTPRSRASARSRTTCHATADENPRRIEEGDCAAPLAVVADGTRAERRRRERRLVGLAVRLVQRGLGDLGRESSPAQRFGRAPAAVAAAEEAACELPGELGVVEVPEPDRLVDRVGRDLRRTRPSPPASSRSPRRTAPSRRAS